MQDISSDRSAINVSCLVKATGFVDRMKLHNFANSADSDCPTRGEIWQHLTHTCAVFHSSLERINHHGD